MRRPLAAAFVLAALAGCAGQAVEPVDTTSSVVTYPTPGEDCSNPTVGEGRGLVWGRITDEGSPVTDARIVLEAVGMTEADNETMTDMNGCYAFGVAYGSYELHLMPVEGPERGHGPFDVNASHRVEHWNIDVHEAPDSA